MKQQVGVVEELWQLKPELLAQVFRLAVVPVMRFIAARASIPFEGLDWNIETIGMMIERGLSLKKRKKAEFSDPLSMKPR